MLAENSSLTTTEAAVLGLVGFGERSGYELARLAEDSVAHLWTPSQSQIYKTLPRLAARGLARRRAVEQQDRPDKSLYRITTAGRSALRRWLGEVDDEPAQGRIVFPLKLFFAEFGPPGTAEVQLGAYRRFLERRLERYEALRTGPKRFDSTYPRLVLEHGIMRVRATLAWIDGTEAALEGITPPSGEAKRPGPPAQPPAC
jgi:PadR family transcriptional regulator, regulatory protein AphA